MAYQTFGESKGASQSNEKLSKLRLPTNLSGKTVLDLGCNEGFFAIECKQRGAARVIGIDKNPEVIHKAKERALDGCVFLCADVLDIPNEQFDLVLLLSALHYLDPILVFPRIHQALKPGGILVLECGVADAPGKIAIRALRSIDDRFFPTYSLLVDLWLAAFAVRLIGPSVSQSGDPISRLVLHCRKRVPTVLFIIGEGETGKTALAANLNAPTIRMDRIMAPFRNWSRYSQAPEQVLYDEAAKLHKGSIKRAWNAVKEDEAVRSFFARKTAEAIRLCRTAPLIVVEGYVLTDIVDEIKGNLGAEFKFWIVAPSQAARSSPVL